MNLLEKLKPEYQEILEEVVKKYPTIYNSIMKSMYKEHIGDLTLFEAYNITLHLDKKNITDIYSLFNI